MFRFVFDKDVVPPVKFHTPRPEHSITFYVRDVQKFSQIHSAKVVTYPPCVINGIYTVPINRYGGHDFWAIKVVFQPTTLFRLKALPVKELTNTFVNAEEVLGNEIAIICENLSGKDKLSDMIVTLERFLLKLVAQRCRSTQPIDKASSYILNQEKPTCLHWLADQSCLSVRQFIRSFEERIGLSPKMFQRIVRFDKAFRMKNNDPGLDWLDIALACGYYDYQHLAKDFKEFTGFTPPAFYDVERKSPERSFGFHES